MRSFYGVVACLLLLQALLGANARAETDTAAAPPAEVLTLHEAQRRAIEGYPSLKAVGERVLQAGARVRQARSAWLPQVEASWTGSHTDLSDVDVESARRGARSALAASGATAGLPSTSVTGSIIRLRNLAGGAAALGGIPESVDSYRVSLGASYLLFNGFGRKHTTAVAKYGDRETRAARDEATRLLLQAVAQSYHAVQLFRERIRIAEADIAFNARLLKEAKLRNEAGAASLSEVLNFEVRSRAAEAALNNARNDYANARTALSVLMNMEDGTLPENVEVETLGVETEEQMSLPDGEAALQTAMASRPDLMRSQWAVKRAGATVGQRRAALYPSVAAFASRDASQGGNSRFGEDDFSTTVGLNVSYDIFTGGRNRAQIAEAKHAQKEAEYQEDEAALGVVSDVRQAVEDLSTAQKQLVLQRDNARYVEKNRDLVAQEYAAGQTSLALLNQSQRDLVEAEGNLALARVSLLAAWHTLRTATGETVKDWPLD
ncbi:MAG: TolC family protein [Candidatus Hydrogenedentes bacterium]|nr:TolC family protein [Candidatus Hydrogenedentota bacterium]